MEGKDKKEKEGRGGGGYKPQAIGQQLHKFDSFEIEYNLISLNH